MSKKSPLGNRLQALRAERGWTIADLARAAGLHYVHLHRIESGERMPRWDTIIQLAAALGVSPEKFLEKNPKNT